MNTSNSTNRAVKTAYVYSGRKFAQYKEQELKKRVLELKRKGVNPKLVAVLVGSDPASVLYTSLKKQAAERIGIEIHLVKLFANTVTEILYSIKQYAKDKSVHGVMVQLPLPGRLNSLNVREKFFKSITVIKDVDGLIIRSPYKSATLRAVMYVIVQAQELGFLPEKLNKTKICLVGAKGVVGKAILNEFKKQKLNIDKCDKDTKNVKSHTKRADLLITATGKPNFISQDCVKPGCVVIDIGAPKPEVEMAVQERASFITPVPGGIGPMTVACLLENTIDAAEKMV